MVNFAPSKLDASATCSWVVVVVAAQLDDCEAAVVAAVPDAFDVEEARDADSYVAVGCSANWDLEAWEAR